MENNKIPNSDYPQELKEVGAASLFLSYLKHTKLKLESVKRTIHPGKSSVTEHEDGHEKLNMKDEKIVENNQTPLQKRRQISNDDQNLTIVSHPMMQKMPWLIGRCSGPMVKVLTHSDVTDKFQRLQLCKRDVKIFDPLLSPEERELLKGKEGIPVTVYGKDCKEYVMYYRFWVNSKSPVLTCGWKKLYIEEELEAGHMFILWMFRHAFTTKLGLLCSSTKPSLTSGEGPSNRRRRGSCSLAH